MRKAETPSLLDLGFVSPFGPFPNSTNSLLEGGWPHTNFTNIFNVIEKRRRRTHPLLAGQKGGEQ